MISNPSQKLSKVYALLARFYRYEQQGPLSPTRQARKDRLEKLKGMLEEELTRGRKKASAIDTPPWISEHIAARGGGWFFPIEVSPGHPAIGHPCDACGEPVMQGDVVFTMPFHGLEMDTWLIQHRLCTAKQFFGPNAEAVLRVYRDRGSKHALFELARFRFDEHAAGCDTCRSSRVIVLKVDRQLPLGSVHEAPSSSIMGNTEALCPEGMQILAEVRATTDRGAMSG